MWIIFVAAACSALATLAYHHHTQQPSRTFTLGALGLLIMVGIGTDNLIKSYELSQLVDKVEASETISVGWYKESRNRNNSIEAVLSLLEQGRFSESKATERLIELYASVPELGNRLRGELLVAIHAIDKTTNAPWHTSIADARVAIQAHNSAWVDHFEKWAQVDPEVLDLPTTSSEIGATFAIAEVEFDGALPLIPLFDLLFDLKSRIDAIFE